MTAQETAYFSPHPEQQFQTQRWALPAALRLPQVVARFVQPLARRHFLPVLDHEASPVPSAKAHRKYFASDTRMPLPFY